MLYDEQGEKVVGIATNDMGVSKTGQRKSTFQRGVELRGLIYVSIDRFMGSLSWFA